MIKPRKSVAAVKRYSPPLEGRRGLIRLDFNENTSPPEALGGKLGRETVSVYPEYGPLLSKLEKFFGVSQGCVMPVCGSGEGLFLIAFTFIEPGRDKSLTSKPTFALIPQALKLVGSKLKEVGVMPDLSFDVPAIRRELRKGVKVAVFASPDNPTGATLGLKTIQSLAAEFPETLFAIDEAYGEYAGESVIPLTKKYPNLLVVKTFSKAWGLAGLRVGVVIGNNNLIDEMRKVRSPYSVNSAGVRALMNLLNRSGEIKKAAALAMKRKAALVRTIRGKGYKAVDGKGNFFLIGMGADAGRFCDFARKCGILLRDRSFMPSMSGYVRANIGTDAENRRFLETLDAFKTGHAVIFDLDDTLVDTSKSFDVAVMKLVAKRSGEKYSRKELWKLRAEGGYNNDWDAAREALRRRGIRSGREELEREGRAIYFSLARKAEKALIDTSLLKRLKKRARLVIWTGRLSDEYEPLWAARFRKYFERTYCVDNFGKMPPKPAPDQLKAIMKELGIKTGYYVGNSVDDMRASCGAGLTPVGVTTTLDAKALQSAGAEIIIKTVNEIERIFRL